MSAAREYERFDEERAELRERAERAEAELAEYKATSEAGAENMGRTLSDAIDSEERLKAEIEVMKEDMREDGIEIGRLRRQIDRLRAALELVSWRQSARVPPPKDEWIFGMWSNHNLHAIHIVRWRESSGRNGWCKLDEPPLCNDPVWWMPIPIPPLEAK